MKASSSLRISPRTLGLIGVLAMAATAAVVAASGCAHVHEKQISVAKHGQRGCNENDVKLGINPNNHKFSAQMDACASPSWGGIEATAKCFKKIYPAVSDSCRMCFAQMAHCSAENCKLACMTNHLGDACFRCTKGECGDRKKNGDFSLQACTGLSASELPPKR